MTSWTSSIKKIAFYKLIVCIIKKKCHGVKQKCKIYAIGETGPLVKQDVMKFEVFILGGQRIDQKRSKGYGGEVERGLRWKHKK